MREQENTQNCGRKPTRKRPVKIPRHKLNYNIKIHYVEGDYTDADRNELSHGGEEKICLCNMCSEV